MGKEGQGLLRLKSVESNLSRDKQFNLLICNAPTFFLNLRKHFLMQEQLFNMLPTMVHGQFLKTYT
jgi:hypothetical protein